MKVGVLGGGLVLSLLLAACSGEGRAPGSSSGSPVVDSLVQPDSTLSVVQVSGADRPLLSLADTAELVLGGAPPRNDAFLDVVGGVLHQDGGVVLADRGLHEVRWYGPRGALRGRSGGEGDSAYRDLAWIQEEEGGGVAVADASQHRITRLDASGSVVEERTLDVPSRPPPDPDALVGGGQALALLSDGRVVAVGEGIALPRTGAGPRPMRAPLRVYAPDLKRAAVVDTVTVVTWYQQPGGPTPVGLLYQGPRLVWGGRTDRVAYSQADAATIRVLDAGLPSVVIEENRPRVPFHPDSLPPGAVHAADSLPAYRHLRVDAMGRIWAHAPTATGRDDDWRVFEYDGSPAGVLRLPRGDELLDADLDRALLLRRGSDGVERVEVRAFARAP